VAVNRRFVPYSPAAVFAVLGDGHSYERWVVGTTKIRSVEPGWPAAGTRLQYQLGRSPARKDDETRSVHYQPDTLLELEAVGRPFGTVRIEFWIEPVRGGALVTLTEHANKGLARLLLRNKLVDLLIWLRNLETLRRLQREIGSPGGGGSALVRR
jgi:Polyketide cyclase / dehydrase and lipid transport